MRCSMRLLELLSMQLSRYIASWDLASSSRSTRKPCQSSSPCEELRSVGRFRSRWNTIVSVGHARLDLVVADRLVLELKACESVLPIHLAQLLSYLEATGQPLGLLINFNVRFLRQGIRRVILTH